MRPSLRRRASRPVDAPDAGRAGVGEEHLDETLADPVALVLVPTFVVWASESQQPIAERTADSTFEGLFVFAARSTLWVMEMTPPENSAT
jgi:hypothetical protein